MIPGEIITDGDDIPLNVGLPRKKIDVINSGDRPIQVGSHYHFYEVNPALQFSRDITRGWRLDITSGTAVRFEPGQKRSVTLVPFGGRKVIYGFRGEIMGELEANNDED